MSETRNKLDTILHFLAKGPAHHLLYLRWKLVRVLQKLLPFSYRRSGSSASHVNRAPSVNSELPDFFFSSDLVESVSRSITENERALCINEANRICDFEFSFRQADPFRFETEIDWSFAPDQNKDWRWDLNRHAYFEVLGFAYRYTGDEKYAAAFVSQIESWIRNNPPHVDNLNWSSVFEVGFRVNSWTWAYFLFKDSSHVSDNTLQMLLNGIESHCQFLSVNLELHARNNHLLLEAKALLLAAIVFPGFRRSSAWKRRARRILYKQIREQVHVDGVHGEMSTHYHRVVTGELLELLALHKINNIDLPNDILSIIQKMVEYEIAFTRPDHTIPLLGDSSQQDTYARFSATQAGPCLFDLANDGFERPRLSNAAAWRLARFPAPSAELAASKGASSCEFPAGGCYLMRCGREPGNAMYLNIDCGPFGLESDPHHGHADALSIDLFARGRSWIVDSGVYSTHTAWNWRRYFRGTRSHNTVVVDGLDQSRLLDSRRVVSTASAACQQWITSPAIDFFEGSHDGYERLDNPVTHNRKIWFIRNAYWLILDSLTGTGEHTFELNYHFQPDLELRLDEQGCQATATDKSARSLFIAAKCSAELTAIATAGHADPVQGWRSENSGQKSPAETLTFVARTTTPLHICTIIVPSDNNGSLRYRIETLCTEQIQENTVSISVRCAEWTDYFFSRNGIEQERRDFASFNTNASVAFVRQPLDKLKPAAGFCHRGSILDKEGALIQPIEEMLS